MHEETAPDINRMKKKEDIAMQTGNLLEKTKPNCRFMIWLWRHHWHNYYSYDVIRVTRYSTNLYLYYFIIKRNLFIKILQPGKNTKNMKLYKIINFQKVSGASNKIVATIKYCLKMIPIVYSLVDYRFVTVTNGVVMSLKYCWLIF